MKAKDIWTGWMRYIGGIDNLPAELQETAQRRFEICLACPHLKKNRRIMRIEKVFRLKSREGYQCGLCGCSIYAKGTVPAAKCPDGRW